MFIIGPGQEPAEMDHRSSCSAHTTFLLQIVIATDAVNPVETGLLVFTQVFGRLLPERRFSFWECPTIPRR